jgi:hypothetical protein
MKRDSGNDRPPAGKRPRRRGKHSGKDRSAGRGFRENDDRVGYGRPPKEHQFKAGHSGNPRGRRRGTKNQETILHAILFRMLTIHDRGRARKVPLIEAVYLKFAEEALRGNPKAADFLLKRYTTRESDEASQDLSEDEREIFEAFVRRVQEQAKRGD